MRGFAMFSCFFMAMCAMTLISPARAADDDTVSHDGKVVSAADSTLVMTTDGKQHSHKIGFFTKIMVKGKSAKLEDLKAGDMIRVTTQKDDPEKVVSVISMEK